MKDHAKRAIALLLAIVMGTLLFACGESDETNATTIQAQDAIVIDSPAKFEGKKISVQSATTASDSMEILQANGLTCQLFPYKKVTQCFDDLLLGRVDAVYVDSVVAGHYTKDSSKFVRTWISDEAEPMGICLQKSSDKLAAAIEAAIDTLNYNGKMEEIAKKNFGTDETAGLRNVTEQPVIPTDFTTVKKGVLAVGVEIGYPPMEYTTDDGKTFIGFDIDLANELGDLLGLEVEFVNTSWEGIFAGLEKGQYDCIISSVSITPERLEKYIITEPYIANALCIVTAA
ncbi:MAG: transporter substrate-binding domain-containing protein [Oscillospiraceae bacterium]|jgi:ABC-type amino acid transport substrate-binding protein|nr:transporter substrate-binding domain-containing protein [Oscillospiraceae bacterium]